MKDPISMAMMGWQVANEKVNGKKFLHARDLGPMSGVPGRK